MRDYLNSFFLFLITCLVSIGVYIFSGFESTLKDVKESVNTLNINVARVIADKNNQDRRIERLEKEHDDDIERLEDSIRDIRGVSNE